MPNRNTKLGARHIVNRCLIQIFIRSIAGLHKGNIHFDEFFSSENKMLNLIKYPLLSILPAFLSLRVHAQGYTEPSGDWHHGWSGGWGWGHILFGSSMMVLFWGGIILVIVLVIRALGSGSADRSGSPSDDKTPLDILNERFARGEIDKDEYEERKRILSD